jgi:hypothetical protein
MVDIIQPSFSAGEVDTRVQARVDLSKRAVAVERAINGLVTVTGSLDRRPGTEFIATTYGNSPARLVPFDYNQEQTYVLVFTDGHLDIYRDGVLRLSRNSPFTGTDYLEFDYAQYGDQMTLVHPDYQPRELLRVADTTWTFSQIDFTPQQPTPTGAKREHNAQEATHQINAVSRGATTVVTSVSAHGLSNNDRVTFGASVPGMTELNYGTFRVDNVTSTTYELREPEDGAAVNSSGWSALSGSPFVYHSPRQRRYAVTAVNGQTGEESLTGTADYRVSIASVSTATPAKATTWNGHGLLTGDEVTFEATGTVLDDNRFFVTRISVTEFTLSWVNGEDVDGSALSVSGGYVRPCFRVAERSKEDKWDNEIRWTAASGAVIYNVYASDGGAYGLIGSTTRARFRDYYIDPDSSIAPPVAFDPFFDPSGGTSRYPAAVAYHNQRRVFARSLEFPNRFWMSQTGNYYNLAFSTPTKDDDAIVASIAGSQINDVAFLLPLSELIALTGGAEFKIDGGGDALTPSTVSARPQSYYGAGGLKPLLAGNLGLLHLTSNVIRDFEYSDNTRKFSGIDLTVMARHLVDNSTFRSWAYGHMPMAAVVMVQEPSSTEGLPQQAPVFTYFPEQEVYGWTRWVTQGQFYSVCSVAEGRNNRFYMIVERVIGGTTTYCLERMTIPTDSPYGYHGVDCGVRYASAWYGYCGHHALDRVQDQGQDGVRAWPQRRGRRRHRRCARDYGDGVAVLDPDGYNGDGFTVANATSDTFRLQDGLGNYIDGSGLPLYSSQGSVRPAVTTVSGLSHLEGETVVAAANGQAFTGLTVSGGSVTLPVAASRVSVGLPYTFEMVTLPVTAYGEGGTVEGKMKNVNRFAVHVVSAGDFWVGAERDGMVLHEKPAVPVFSRQVMMERSQLVTVPGKWGRNRQIILQQRDPLPMSVASIIPDALIGDT